MWVLADVFFNGKLVGAGFVFGDDAADDGHAALFDLGLEGCQVVVEVAVAELGDDGRAGAGDEVVLLAQDGEEAVPARDDGVFVAGGQAQLELAEAVGEGLGFPPGEGGECVGDVALGLAGRCVHGGHGGGMASVVSCELPG